LHKFLSEITKDNAISPKPFLFIATAPRGSITNFRIFGTLLRTIYNIERE